MMFEVEFLILLHIFRAARDGQTSDRCVLCEDDDLN